MLRSRIWFLAGRQAKDTLPALKLEALDCSFSPDCSNKTFSPAYPWSVCFLTPTAKRYHRRVALTDAVPQNLLIDADDTLWENNIYFERAIADFISFLNHR